MPAWAAESISKAKPTRAVAQESSKAKALKPSTTTTSRSNQPAPAPVPATTPAATASASASSAASRDEGAIRCVSDKEPALPRLLGEADTGQVMPEGLTSPRERLDDMVRATLERSYLVGATTLLAEASVLDIAEVQAGNEPQSSANISLGPQLGWDQGVTQSNALRIGTGAQVIGTLYDGGRTQRMTDWRKHLADAARRGSLNTQEQLALNTVSLALERSRFRLQTVIYSQHIDKMSCLVRALDAVVQADRGRASELIQAKKSLQQAELSRHQAQSTLRQIETRLRRLVGDGLPPVQGMVYSFAQPESLPVLMGKAARANEILQMEAQTQAATQYVRVLEASKKPQVGWTVGGQTSQGLGGSLGRKINGTNLSVGINITIPLHNPGVDIAIESAQKRAQATQMQRDEALKNRFTRLEESFVQAQTLSERIQQIAAVLDNTQQLRNFTLQQWQQLGRRSLFDVMSAESEHYNLQVQYVNGLHDEQQMRGVMEGLGNSSSDNTRKVISK
jgi:outer membrane protein, adhesin transport system